MCYILNLFTTYSLRESKVSLPIVFYPKQSRSHVQDRQGDHRFQTLGYRIYSFKDRGVYLNLGLVGAALV